MIERLSCRCGRADVVRRPPGYGGTIDIVHDYTGVSAVGFPVGWSVWAWKRRTATGYDGQIIHVGAYCPDCPKPTDPRAVEVSRA